MAKKTYLVRQIAYVEQEFDPADLMTIKEAAEVLNRTVWAVVGLLDKGRVTEIHDPNAAGRHGLRLLLRSEIEALRQERDVAE